MPHGDHRVEGKSEPAALYSVCAKKIKTVQKPINCFGEGSKLFADFCFSRRVLECNSHKNEE
jgi:hypothetical protein